MSVYEHGPVCAKLALQFPPPGGSDLRPLPFRDDLLRPADHTGARASDGGTWSQRIYEHTPHLLFLVIYFFLITLILRIQLRSFLPAVQALYCLSNLLSPECSLSFHFSGWIRALVTFTGIYWPPVFCFRAVCLTHISVY